MFKMIFSIFEIIGLCVVVYSMAILGQYIVKKNIFFYMYCYNAMRNKIIYLKNKIKK